MSLADLPSQKVPIWSDYYHFAAPEGQAYEWVPLAGDTESYFEKLKAAEKAYLQGDSESLQSEMDFYERPIRTNPAAIRLAQAPAAWLPPPLQRNEDTVPPEKEVMQADLREELLAMPRRVYQGLSGNGIH